MSINHCLLAGNVVSDPWFDFVGPSNSPKARFRIASTKRRVDDAGRWSDGGTVYITVECWRSLAQHVNASLHRGDGVIVSGELIHEEWDDKEGNHRSELRIVARSVAIDLSRHDGKVVRAVRSTTVDEAVTDEDFAAALGPELAGGLAGEGSTEDEEFDPAEVMEATEDAEPVRAIG